uniref:Uncharacterized protein n=2 Tax=Caenorhabditis japonica TaxID=281687 RepID=A0A8R1I2D1_CAEJA
MKPTLKLIFWTILAILLYVADNSMFSSDQDSSSPQSWPVVYEEYYTLPLSPSATPKLSTTPVNFLAISATTKHDKRSHVLEAAGLVFVTGMILLFVILYHINSDKYRRAVIEQNRRMEAVINAKREAMEVMNVNSCQVNFSETKFVPRSVFGKQLSVVREVSQE